MRGYVETLASAYAEAGEFEKAVEFQWFAISLITDETVRAEGEKRLRLYEKRRPYREGESGGERRNQRDLQSRERGTSPAC